MVSALRPTPGRMGVGPWTRALMPLLTAGLVLLALPGQSRLAASSFAAARAVWRGNSAWRVMWAFLQPRESESTTLTGERPADSRELWNGVGGATLAPPAEGVSAHEAALERAVAEGWVSCGKEQGACVAGFRKVRAALGDDEALEAVVLGDGDGVRVKQAMATARAAGLEGVELPAVHAPFLPLADRGRLPQVERALGLATLWSLQWPLPVGTRITSPFGGRVHPVLGKRIVHKGVDLEARVGTPLKAPGRARVVHVGSDTAEGLYVVLDHGHGVQSVSCHLDSAEVNRREEVVTGSVFAHSGQSGRVTGPHLHYGVRLGGQFVDPVAVSRRVP